MQPVSTRPTIACQSISCRLRYSHALEALSHALVLAPQNPFTFLQFAETAYTSGDLPLALKMYLVVAEMTERDQEKDEIPTGITLRAWIGAKLVSIPDLSSVYVRHAHGLSFSVPDNLYPQGTQLHLIPAPQCQET